MWRPELASLMMLWPKWAIDSSFLLHMDRSLWLESLTIRCWIWLSWELTSLVRLLPWEIKAWYAWRMSRWLLDELRYSCACLMWIIYDHFLSNNSCIANMKPVSSAGVILTRRGVVKHPKEFWRLKGRNWSVSNWMSILADLLVSLVSLLFYSPDLPNFGCDFLWYGGWIVQTPFEYRLDIFRFKAYEPKICAELSDQNNGKASILNETIRLVNDMISQIQTLRKENATLLSESHYVSPESLLIISSNSYYLMLIFVAFC